MARVVPIIMQLLSVGISMPAGLVKRFRHVALGGTHVTLTGSGVLGWAPWPSFAFVPSGVRSWGTPLLTGTSTTSPASGWVGGFCALRAPRVRAVARHRPLSLARASPSSLLPAYITACRRAPCVNRIPFLELNSVPLAAYVPRLTPCVNRMCRTPSRPSPRRNGLLLPPRQLAQRLTQMRRCGSPRPPDD